MKKIFAFVSTFALATSALAVDYNGAGGAIPDGAGANTPGPAFTSTISVPDSFTVGDVDVTIDFQHTWVGDLEITLENGANAALLVSRIGWSGVGAGDNANYNGTYTFDSDGGDDAWAVAASDPSSAFDMPSGTYRTSDANTGAANSSLDVFDGQNSAGDWTLRIVDNFNFDLGNVNGWTLSIVPEPTSLSLLALGALGLIRRR